MLQRCRPGEGRTGPTADIAGDCPAAAYPVIQPTVCQLSCPQLLIVGRAINRLMMAVNFPY